MTNLKLKAIPEKLNPVVKYANIEMLFDTGADTPVWCSGLELFKRIFPMAILEKYQFLLSGFGRSQGELLSFVKNLNDGEIKEYIVDVYRIPEFVLESGGQRIVWRDLRVAVTNRETLGVNMILPCTMFRGMVLRVCQSRIINEIEIISPKTVVNVKVEVMKIGIRELLRNIYGQDNLGEVIESL